MSSSLAVEIAISVAYLALMAWCVIDAARKPAQKWKAAGHSKVAWVAGLLLSVFFGLGLFVAVFYVIWVRPSVKEGVYGPRWPVGGVFPMTEDDQTRPDEGTSR